MKKVLMMTVALMLMAVPSSAQQPTQEEIDKYIELVRIDVRQERSELVGAAMQLSAGQATKFWPIYEEYEAAFTALGDTELKLIRDYADAFFAMTDSAADGLVDRFFQLNDDELKLMREYHGKVSSALGGAVAARFVQVENRIRMLLDMQLAAEIPLAGRFESLHVNRDLWPRDEFQTPLDR